MAPKCAFGEGCTRAILVKPDADPTVSRPSKYCDRHTCTGFAGEDPCFKRVTKNGDIRCITHVQCKAMFCKKPRLAAANGGWWECCSIHKCKEEDCMKLVEYHNIKERYFKYCLKHKCVIPNCEKATDGAKKQCKTHTCFNRDCNKPTEANFYCIDHTCELAGCTNSIVYYLDNFDISAKSRFCPIHECQKENCHKASRNSKFGYCREHSCDRMDCPNLKLIDPGSNPPLLLCRKHYDESRNPPREAAAKFPSPAPAPVPQRLDPDLERKLDGLKREQREQRDKLEDILRILDRRL